MKQLAFYLFLLGWDPLAYAQDPVKWSATYHASGAADGELLITAIIEKGHHIYSQRETDAGPINTVITFNQSPGYKLIAKTEELGGNDNYDKVLEAKVYSFSDKAEFRKKIKLTGAKKSSVITFLSAEDGISIKLFWL